jgi:hypothetical protein
VMRSASIIADPGNAGARSGRRGSPPNPPGSDRLPTAGPSGVSDAAPSRPLPADRSATFGRERRRDPRLRRPCVLPLVERATPSGPTHGRCSVERRVSERRPTAPQQPSSRGPSTTAHAPTRRGGAHAHGRRRAGGRRRHDRGPVPRARRGGHAPDRRRRHPGDRARPAVRAPRGVARRRRPRDAPRVGGARASDPRARR